MHILFTDVCTIKESSNGFFFFLVRARSRALKPVGYREKGYPKPEPKNDCLDFVKIETS